MMYLLVRTPNLSALMTAVTSDLSVLGVQIWQLISWGSVKVRTDP